MATLSDRLHKLERADGGNKAARWHAEMDGRQQICAEARLRLAALIESKLAERGIDPDHMPPQTPEQHAESKRAWLDALKARLRD